MLRFRSGVKTVKTSRNRLRLWLLVIALGLVLATMRQLGRPSTARRLEQLFANLRPTAASQVPNPLPAIIKAPLPEASQAQEGQDRLGLGQPRLPVGGENVAGDEAVEGLSQVRDNTFFRPAERKAWFSLFAKLQQTSDRELVTATCGDVSYAQLLQQPEVYRGRLVTIVGKVLREEPQQPAKNQLGIDSYHRLWIQPQGGGQWPLVAYSLKLPADFPRGENLDASVSVTGFFFKNWSYAYDEGLGLAPVVLANQFDWQPPRAQPRSEPISSGNWIVAIALACVFAATATWLAARLTRRRPCTISTVRGDLQPLQELASRESEV